VVAEAIRQARSREPREDIGGSRWQARTAEVRAWALRAGNAVMERWGTDLPPRGLVWGMGASGHQRLAGWSAAVVGTGSISRAIASGLSALGVRSSDSAAEFRFLVRDRAGRSHEWPSLGSTTRRCLAAASG
jgi:hypothetical protein